MEIAKNKKAYFDYEVLEEYDAGIALTGDEIKSVRDKKSTTSWKLCKNIIYK